jgi:hypothetical protein
MSRASRATLSGGGVVVDFSTCWWISTTPEYATSVQDSSLQGILNCFRKSMLARALRFRWDKNT